MSARLPRGVVAPNLTPFNDDGSIALDLYTEHAHRLLNWGCVGLAPFGTTGEALSVGIDERIDAIDALIGSGIDPVKLVPGTGLTSLADTVRLSKACLERGCAAVMTLPPFYFKGVADEGLVAYFEALVEALGRDAAIYLYHIPQIAGVGIPPAVVAELHRRYPEQIVGIKDSTGDWDNTAALFDIEGLVVYPGTELPLVDALDRGGPGCISATANINAPAIAKVVERYVGGDQAGAAEDHKAVQKLRLLMQNTVPPIPGQKYLFAQATGDKRWANVRPPLVPLSEEKGEALVEALEIECGFKLVV